MGTYHRIGVIIILALLLSACGTPSSTARDQPQPTGDQPMTMPTAPSRITQSTLSELKLIGEVTLPFAREAAIAPASDRLAVATSTTVTLFNLPSLRQLQSAQ